MTATAPAPAARKPVEPGAEPPPPERTSVSRWIPAAVIVAGVVVRPVVVPAMVVAAAMVVPTVVVMVAMVVAGRVVRPMARLGDADPADRHRDACGHRRDPCSGAFHGVLRVSPSIARSTMDEAESPLQGDIGPRT